MHSECSLGQVKKKKKKDCISCAYRRPSQPLVQVLSLKWIFLWNGFLSVQNLCRKQAFQLPFHLKPLKTPCALEKKYYWTLLKGNIIKGLENSPWTVCTTWKVFFYLDISKLGPEYCILKNENHVNRKQWAMLPIYTYLTLHSQSTPVCSPQCNNRETENPIWLLLKLFSVALFGCLTASVPDKNKPTFQTTTTTANKTQQTSAYFLCSSEDTRTRSWITRGIFFKEFWKHYGTEEFF